MASAAASPSPVAMMTFTPSSLRKRMASALSGLTGSDISTEPANLPSTDAMTQVIPGFSSCPAGMSVPRSFMRPEFPTTTFLPPQTHSIPLPEMLPNSS